MEVREYQSEDGHCPFSDWFNDLEVSAAAKVTTALVRLELGNTSNVKGVGAGVFEFKIAYGPGYRVYFGKDGAEIVILLGGGTKKRQDQDIDRAKQCWQDYKSRK